MSCHIVDLIDMLNKNKVLIKDSFVQMLKHKQECPDKDIDIRAKILFVALLSLLCELKKGNYNNKNHSDLVFYRSIFFYIFNNIYCVRYKKSIIKNIYIKINNLKKICENKFDERIESHYSEPDTYITKNKSIFESLPTSDTSLKTYNFSYITKTNTSNANLHIDKLSTTEDSNSSSYSKSKPYTKNTNNRSSFEKQITNTSADVIDTITTHVTHSTISQLTTDINNRSIHSRELNPKYECEEKCLDNKDKLIDSHKVLGLLKILLCTLEKDLSHTLSQLNLKEPSEQASDIDIDYLNRVLYIFFSQYLTIITKHYNLFFNKDGPDTYKIKFNDNYISVCTLDNLDIKEDKINNVKVIILTVGKHISIIRYNEEGTNDTVNTILRDNIDNISTALSIINTNYKILDSCLDKLCQMDKIIN